jgi:hypothetical protein
MFLDSINSLSRGRLGHLSKTFISQPGF